MSDSTDPVDPVETYPSCRRALNAVKASFIETVKRIDLGSATNYRVSIEPGDACMQHGAAWEGADGSSQGNEEYDGYFAFAQISDIRAQYRVYASLSFYMLLFARLRVRQRPA